MPSEKKASPITGIIFIICVVLAFIYLPNLVAFLIAFGGFGALLIVGEIAKQITMIRLRNQTNKSTIAAAPEGFTEIVGKIKNPTEIKTFLTDERADYRSVIFSYTHQTNREGDLTAIELYVSETDEKVLSVYDGSATCYVLLHAAQLHLHTKVKHLKTEEIKRLLKDKPLKEFPIEALDEYNKLTVTERWVRRGEKLNCYGFMRNMKYGERANDLLAVHEKEIKRLDSARRNLNETDWQKIEGEAGSDYKIMTTHYVDLARRDVRELIISLKDDKQLNKSSYLQILLMLIILLVLLSFCIGITWSQYPELILNVLELFSI